MRLWPELCVVVLLGLGAAAAPGGVEYLGPKPPVDVRRAVTLAPSLTETVVALGAGERLVGVSRFDELSQVAALPRVGGFNDVAVESVMALEPQVVLVQKAPGNQKAVETLGRLGVSVVALPLTTVEDVLASFRLLGKLFQREVAAQELVGELLGARSRVRAAQGGAVPNVLFVYGFSPLVVAGPGSFAHQLLEDCGARNVVQKAPTAYPAYSVERAVRLAPDIIIDAADAVESREAVKALKPLQQAQWIVLPSKDLLHPGPSLARGLQTLCGLIGATH